MSLHLRRRAAQHLLRICLPLIQRRGLGGSIVRGVTGWIWGTAAVSDPLDARYVPYLGPGKRSLTLIMDATNKCNLRCIMCHFALEEVQTQKSVQWDAVHVRRIEEELLPFVQHAYLSAGTEPLMSKVFGQVLDAVQRARVPEVEMITNGLLLTDSMAERIVRSGITRMHFSVDGATKETYERVRVGGNFEQFQASVRCLNAAKQRLNLDHPQLQFNFTIMASNVGDLVGLIEMAAEHQVPFVDLRHMVINGDLDIEHESLLKNKRLANRQLAKARLRAKQLGIHLVRCPEDFELSAEEECAEEPGLVSSRAVEARHLVALRNADAVQRAPSTPETPDCAESVEIGGFLPAALAPLDAREEPPGPGPAPGAELQELELGPMDIPKRPLCDAPWTQYNVRPDRTVTPCCFWYTGAALGDLGTQSFEEIRQGHGYRKLRWEILSGNLSSDCAGCPVIGIGDAQDDSAYRANRDGTPA